MKSVIAATLTITALVAGAAQAQECRVTVLRPVRDDIGNVWKPGQTLPVDVARDDAGGRSFCAHGGACVPRMANGAVAVRLANCRVGATIGGDDHQLVADPRTMGAAAAARWTLRDRTEERLSAMGFSNASAGSFADDYANHPASPDGRLVAQALAGSHAAAAALRTKLP